MPADRPSRPAAVKVLVADPSSRRDKLLDVQVRDTVLLPDTAVVRVRDPRAHRDRRPRASSATRSRSTSAPPSEGQRPARLQGRDRRARARVRARRLHRRRPRLRPRLAPNRQRRSRTFQNRRRGHGQEGRERVPGSTRARIESTGAVHDFFQQSMETDWDFAAPARRARQAACSAYDASGRAVPAQARADRRRARRRRCAWRRRRCCPSSPRADRRAAARRACVVAHLGPGEQARAVVGVATHAGARSRRSAQQARRQGRRRSAPAALLSSTDVVVTTQAEARPRSRRRARSTTPRRRPRSRRTGVMLGPAPAGTAGGKLTDRGASARPTSGEHWRHRALGARPTGTAPSDTKLLDLGPPSRARSPT